MIYYYRYLFVKMKVFNYSELHFSEVTSYKILTLVFFIIFGYFLSILIFSLFQQPHQQPPQYQRQHSSNSGGDNFNYNNHYNEPQINPAWRGMSEHTPGYRQPLTAPSTAAPSSDRYLYDPRNPKKPIPAQRGARFPMDPRFAPPPTLAAVAPAGPPGGSGSGGPPGGLPGGPPGYRPPFPPTIASSSSSSMMPGSATAEGEEAAKILGKIV